MSLQNLDTESAPAKHARTLTGHLNTFLASMQAYYAGALGVAYVNIMYAPYLEGMSYKRDETRGAAPYFQLFSERFFRARLDVIFRFQCSYRHSRYLRNIPAIGPSGKPTGKTYGDYEETARQFTLAMLDVWREGDCYGHVFAFPKCDFHINEDTLNDPKQYELLEYACQIASENGVPYFIFDRAFLA